MDMKVFWHIDQMFKYQLDNLTGDTINFIPDCGTDNFFTKIDN